MTPVEILLAIVGLSVLVIAHESGHYFAARAFKMKVLRYSIGFGPTLFKHKPKGSDTVFQVAAIPFLAYVQIAGMNPYEENDPDEEGLFNDATPFARIVTVAAGPVANYAIAILLAFIIGLVGWPGRTYQLMINPDDARVQVPAVAGEVVEDSAAHEAGVLAGDTFVSVDGTTIDNFAGLQEQTQRVGGQATEYVVRRDGEEVTLTITPRVTDGRPLIGVSVAQPVLEPVQLGIAEAASTAIAVPWKLTVYQLESIKNMIVRLDSSNLGGPVAIARGFGQAAKAGPTAFFVMMMMMSVALGLFNLLPFPALDGGRLFFLIIEVITRRKPNERFEATVHMVGIVILLLVLVLVTVRDITG